jgi:Leucine-rich repeat (LRR) protein
MLQRNRIHTVDKALGRLTNIQQLDLSFNYIKELPMLHMQVRVVLSA